MDSSKNISSDKQFLLNFISKTENSSLISKLKKKAEKLLSKEEKELFIPEWHKEIVRKRIKSSKLENMISLEDLDKHLTV